MAYSQLPSMLQMILSRQGRGQLSPEEEALLQAQQAQEQAPPMDKIMLAQGPNPAEVFARSPGSTANMIMNRKNQAGQVLPEDSIGMPVSAPSGNAPARQSVRGASSAPQREQLIMLLMKRGMTREQAEAAAAGM